MERRDEEEDTDQVNRPAYNAHWGPKQNTMSGFRWHMRHGTHNKVDAMEKAHQDLYRLVKENRENPAAFKSFSRACSEAGERLQKLKK